MKKNTVGYNNRRVLTPKKSLFSCNIVVIHNSYSNIPMYVI